MAQTDLDLGAALSTLEGLPEGDANESDDINEASSRGGRLAEALTAVGTVKMLLGEQNEAIASLKRAVEMYRTTKDSEGEAKAEGLLVDVRKIMEKVDSH